MKSALAYTLKNGAWIVVNYGTTFLLSFVTLMLFANFTSKETVGIYSYAVSIGSIANIFTLPGMQNALTRSVAQGFEASLARMLRLQMLYGLGGVLAVLSVAAWYGLSGKTALATVLCVIGVCLPVWGNPGALVAAFWRGRKRFRSEAAFAILQQFIVSVAAIAVMLLGGGGISVMSTFIVSACAAGMLSFVLTLRRVKPSAPDPENERFGKHLTLMQILNIVGANLDKVVVWHFLGPVAVAAYTMGFVPITKIARIMPFNFLLLPIVSKRSFEPELRRKIFWYALAILAAMAPVAAVLYALAPALYAIFFPRFAVSMPLFRALLPLAALAPVNAFIRTAFTGTKQTDKLYATSFVTPGVRIVLLCGLIPAFGMSGAVAAQLASTAAATAINFYYLLAPRWATAAPALSSV